jgi:hypothetical protein
VVWWLTTYLNIDTQRVGRSLCVGGYSNSWKRELIQRTVFERVIVVWPQRYLNGLIASSDSLDYPSRIIYLTLTCCVLSWERRKQNNYPTTCCGVTNCSCSRPQSHCFGLSVPIYPRGSLRVQRRRSKSLYAYPMGRHNLDLAADPQRPSRSRVVVSAWFAPLTGSDQREPQKKLNPDSAPSSWKWACFRGCFKSCDVLFERVDHSLDYLELLPIDLPHFVQIRTFLSPFALSNLICLKKSWILIPLPLLESELVFGDVLMIFDFNLTDREVFIGACPSARNSESNFFQLINHTLCKYGLS